MRPWALNWVHLVNWHRNFTVISNMGAIDDENSVQVSGVIQIPTRCVLNTTHLSEPLI